MFKKALLYVLAALSYSHAFAAWDFRGEPNNWGTTPMTPVANDANRFVIRQVFSASQDEFKIAKDAGWAESYPAQNFKVTPGKTYDITFFQNTHSIQAVEVVSSSSLSSKATSVSSSSNVSSSVSSKVSSSLSSVSSKSSSSASSKATINSSAVSSEKWLFRGTPNSWGINTPMTKLGDVFVTCQNFAANDPRFKISNGNKLTPTTWVEAYPAQDQRVAANTSFDIIFDSKTKAITTIARTTLCGVIDTEIDTERSLLVHDVDTLNFVKEGASVFGIKRVMAQLAAQLNAKNPTHPTTASELFGRMWDSQNTPANRQYQNGPVCTGMLNGFVSECRAAEGEQAKDPAAAMDNYVPIALVNRFDLHDTEYTHCGEYRIVFAVKNIQVRNFIAFESQLSSAKDLKTCLAVVNFWKNLSKENNAETRAQLLADFYFKGLPASGAFPAVPAVININNLSAGTGEIRTNEFMSSTWLLKEFQIAIENNLSHFKPVSLKENPYGALFNDLNTDSLATEFRTQFINNIGSLLTSDLGVLRLSVQNDAHNNGQSHSSGQYAIDNNYLDWANKGTSEFKAAVADRVSKLGSLLSADQVINRATAESCAGCHNPSMYQLDADSSVGANQSWPQSLGFTHISEFTQEDVTKYDISPALRDVFLPSRKAGMEAFLKSF